MTANEAAQNVKSGIQRSAEEKRVPSEEPIKAYGVGTRYSASAA
jgi:hypothetical protein